MYFLLGRVLPLGLCKVGDKDGAMALLKNKAWKPSGLSGEHCTIKERHAISMKNTSKSILTTHIRKYNNTYQHIKRSIIKAARTLLQVESFI